MADLLVKKPNTLVYGEKLPEKQKLKENPLVRHTRLEAIKKANLKVAIDAVNSVGGISIPPLLKALGVNNTIELYCEPNGIFPHNPEPLPENLTEISAKIKESGADIDEELVNTVFRAAHSIKGGAGFFDLSKIRDLGHKVENVLDMIRSREMIFLVLYRLKQ